MAIAIVTAAHIGAGSPDGGSFNTSAIDTSGCDLLVACVGSYGPGAAPTLTDSKGNTWTSLTAQVSGLIRSQLWYAKNPTVGSGHTFNVSGGDYQGIEVQGFSGADLTAPYDTPNENGAAGGAGSIAPGSITPSADGALVVAGGGAEWNISGYLSTIDSGFTITDQVSRVGGQCFGSILAYKIQTTASAVNPTWTGPGGGSGTANIASFLAAAGGGGGGGKLFLPTSLDGLGAGGPFFHNPIN